MDVDNERLWKGSQAIKLTPKAFAVLDYLLCRAGQLVTKEELLNAVWPNTFVGEANLKVTIRQLRDALDDDSKSPRFIETAHRRGYRFIGQTIEGRLPGNQEAARKEESSASPPCVAYSPLPLVGRDEALSRMQSWLRKMLGGERQIVFVTGEAGVGKTALVEAFARNLPLGRRIRIGRGQCLEHYGTGEAYLPVLEAMGRLGREQRQVVDVLRAHAPMWLLQMPSLVSASDRKSLSRAVSGATRERMLREMGEAVEELTADLPLVLILEDLHWSDYSTLDLVSYLARQTQAAHLMLIGTYRTPELIASGHPLKAVKQELLAKQQCQELPLEYLTEDSVAEYLSARFPNNRFPVELAGLLYERTGGNALFMVSAVDYLVSGGSIVKDEESWQLAAAIKKVDLGVPENIKQMIEKQLDRLDGEQLRTLEAASVAGAEFSTVALAAGLGEDQAAVEARCDELSRRYQFIQDCGVHDLQDGELVSRYSFRHVLYQNTLYERVSASRRVRLHRRIGEQEEELYGSNAREIATELALHFERGSNYKQAAKYLQQAAENAIRRFAYDEAIGLSRRGLVLLGRLPNAADRARQELALQITLGAPLIATKGYAAPEVGRVYTRARELCRQSGETPEVSQVLWGLWTFHTLRADLGEARETAQELLRLAKRLPHSGLDIGGHWAMEITCLHMGKFARALEHFKNGIAVYEPERHLDDAFRYALNPGVAMRSFAACALWFLGRPDRALDRIQEALILARELSEPHGLAHASFFASILHQLRREERMSQEYAEAAIAVSSEHGLSLYYAIANIVRGWALSRNGRHQEAIEQMRQGIAAYRATDARVLTPHFLALLVGATQDSSVEERLGLMKEALAVAHRSGEECYVAELYRIKGELLLTQGTDGGRSQEGTVWRDLRAVPRAVALAEACFRRSIEIARQQKALSWELRAVMSLARLFQAQNKHNQARTLLAQTRNMFTEGFGTADLLDAKALLDELSQ